MRTNIARQCALAPNRIQQSRRVVLYTLHLLVYALLAVPPFSVLFDVEKYRGLGVTRINFEL